MSDYYLSFAVMGLVIIILMSAVQALCIGDSVVLVRYDDDRYDDGDGYRDG